MVQSAGAAVAGSESSSGAGVAGTGGAGGGELETRIPGKRGPDKGPRKPRGAGGQINLAELQAAFPEEFKQATDTAELLQFKPEEVEAILALVGLTLGKWVAKKMEREELTEAEADRWAKCTRIVFWQYLQNVEAGMLVWVLLTFSLFATKKSTKKPKEKAAT